MQGTGQNSRIWYNILRYTNYILFCCWFRNIFIDKIGHQPTFVVLVSFCFIRKGGIDKINFICYTILNNKKGRKLNQKINTKSCYL